jgi:hypothetical protein
VERPSFGKETHNLYGTDFHLEQGAVAKKLGQVTRRLLRRCRRRRRRRRQVIEVIERIAALAAAFVDSYVCVMSPKQVEKNGGDAVEDVKAADAAAKEKMTTVTAGKEENEDEEEAGLTDVRNKYYLGFFS